MTTEQIRKWRRLVPDGGGMINGAMFLQVLDALEKESSIHRADHERIARWAIERLVFQAARSECRSVSQEFLESLLGPGSVLEVLEQVKYDPGKDPF